MLTPAELCLDAFQKAIRVWCDVKERRLIRGEYLLPSMAEGCPTCGCAITALANSFGKPFDALLVEFPDLERSFVPGFDGEEFAEHPMSREMFELGRNVAAWAEEQGYLEKA